MTSKRRWNRYQDALPTEEQRARRAQRRADRKKRGITTSSVSHQMRHGNGAKARKRREDYRP